MKKVALFTDFNPTSGGGAAILRNLLKRFNNVQVQWFYTSSTTIDLPGTTRIARLSGKSNPVGDLVDFYRLWSGRREKELIEMAKPILAASADVHWVVAHGEGIGLGIILKTLEPEIPLHVTVHDDPEHGLLKRSRRYRLLAHLVHKPMKELMTRADSVDVISRLMREYYHKQFGVKSEVVHICVDRLPKLAPFVKKDHQLKIGHIGSIYSHDQFAKFLQGVAVYALKKGLKPVLKLIGKQSWPAGRFAGKLSPGASVNLLGEMREEHAIAQLSDCDFVYAAYPFNNAARVFRQTSLPTKLSTYVQAQRPIFAHTTMDSTLANAVIEFQAGIVCPHSGVDAIAHHIEIIESLKISRENFEVFRDRLFGAHNVSRLENLLLQSSSCAEARFVATNQSK
jgi:glycosyltransferase involved in cell wall biosynthesis